MGIRIALGAGRASVQRLGIGEGLALVAVATTESSASSPRFHAFFLVNSSLEKARRAPYSFAASKTPQDQR
jgi:hypothetical protein